MWEIYEFDVDSLFSTNMQIYISLDFYDALLKNGTIGLTVEEIASFYSTPEGYRYALMDTMGDILIDVGGALAGTIASYYLFKFRPELSAKLIYKEKKIQDEI